jgi:hypothetical protein
MTVIPIQVDPEIAQAFQSFQPEQQQQIQALMNQWLKEVINISKLQMTMDELSDEAEKNGLTPEILESILNEN